MDSMVFYPSSVLRLNSFSTLGKLKKPFYALKEIADGPSPLASRRNHHQATNLSIRFEGNDIGWPSQRSFASGRFQNRDGEKIPQSSDGELSNSSNQEEVINLFRRIRTSISKGESISSKKRSLKSSQEKPASESVLEVLRRARRKGKETMTKKGEKLPATRHHRLKDEDKTDYPAVEDFKLVRLPSNFAKRSPIPTAPSSTLISDEKSKPSFPTEGDNALNVHKMEDMKLPALKELAKSRGLRGYSKLKKSELIELLRL